MKSKVCVFSFFLYLLFALPAFCAESDYKQPVSNPPAGDFLILYDRYYILDSNNIPLIFLVFNTYDEVVSAQEDLINSGIQDTEITLRRCGSDTFLSWYLFVDALEIYESLPPPVMSIYDEVFSRYASNYVVENFGGSEDVDCIPIYGSLPENPEGGDVTEYQTQVLTLLEELPIIKECVLYTFVSCALLWGSVLYISFMQRR